MLQAVWPGCVELYIPKKLLCPKLTEPPPPELVKRYPLVHPGVALPLAVKLRPPCTFRKTLCSKNPPVVTPFSNQMQDELAPVKLSKDRSSNLPPIKSPVCSPTALALPLPWPSTVKPLILAPSAPELNGFSRTSQQ